MYNYKCCCIWCLESKGYKVKWVDVLEKKGLKKGNFWEFWYWRNGLIGIYKVRLWYWLIIIGKI